MTTGDYKYLQSGGDDSVINRHNGITHKTVGIIYYIVPVSMSFPCDPPLQPIKLKGMWHVQRQDQGSEPFFSWKMRRHICVRKWFTRRKECTRGSVQEETG